MARGEGGRRIAITGLGPVSAVGVGAGELTRSLRQGKTAVSMHEIDVDGRLWARFPMARVDGFDIERFDLGGAVLQHLRSHDVDRDQDLLYLLASVKLALEDSGLRYDEAENDIGIVAAHENPGVDHLIQELITATLGLIDSNGSAGGDKLSLITELHSRFQKRFYNLHSFMYLYHLSKAFRLHGYSLFVNNACASGLYALEAAARQIASGDSPAVVVAASDHPCYAPKYLWFRQHGLYAEDGLMRPFDQRRNGFILGDGAGAMVLEDLGHARRRGARIYAEYLGGGFTQDAWKVTVPSVLRNYYARALRRALDGSGVSAGEVDLLNPHGVATQIGDRCEAEAITEVFGKWPERPRIAAFKPYLGHNLGGSALLEAIALLVCLSEGFIPATPNYEQKDPALAVAPLRESVEADLRTVVKMSNGFAGYNAAAVFRRMEGGA